MKKTLLSASLAGLLLSAGTIAPVLAADPSLDSEEKKVSYSMGLIFGQRMLNDIEAVDTDTFISGIRDGLEGNDPKLSEDEIRSVLQSFQQQQQQKQMQEMKEMADKNLEASNQFLAENAEREGVKTTDSGLQYEVIEEGSGESPDAGDQVKVHYTGTLPDGTVFDSSRERGEPVTFALGDVIPGWTEGLQLMKEGGRMKLYLPPSLAYGPGGNRSIGPNQALVFDVELLEVNPES
jgi:FKBP-type peptidyl-prolyl cis-trans isomerase FklB